MFLFFVSTQVVSWCTYFGSNQHSLFKLSHDNIFIHNCSKHQQCYTFAFCANVSLKSFLASGPQIEIQESHDISFCFLVYQPVQTTLIPSNSWLFCRNLWLLSFCCHQSVCYCKKILHQQFRLSKYNFLGLPGVSKRSNRVLVFLL